MRLLIQSLKRTMFQLSPDGLDFVKKEMKRYETKLSAVIPALYRVQEENGGWVSPECISYLSKVMDLSEAQIYETFTFYTMFNKKPVGKLHVQVCCNITCSMKGAKKLLENLKKSFPKDSKNPSCSFSAVECLGSCDTAPVIQINREPYIENTSYEEAKKIISKKLSNSS